MSILNSEAVKIMREIQRRAAVASGRQMSAGEAQEFALKIHKIADAYLHKVAARERALGGRS